MSPHSENPQSSVLWNSRFNEPIVERVAVAGDFLPAGSLQLRSGAGWREMAASLLPYFSDVGTSFINLEGSIRVEGLLARQISGIGACVAAPVACIEYLEAIRACTVGLANNHAFDFGVAGVQRTRDALSRAGFTPIGAGNTLKQRAEICVWQGTGGLHVGFWAAAKVTHDPATEKSKGVEPATVRRAGEALEAMKALGAGCCVALLHAGCARSNRPDPEDVKLLHAIAMLGFDVVGASHSHRISGFTKIVRSDGRPSFCFHGLGSLVSGYIAGPIEREGLIIVLAVNSRGELARVEAKPVLLDETGFGTVPEVECSQAILNRFYNLSWELNDASSKRLFYEDMAHELLRFSVRDVRAAFLNAGIRGLLDKAGQIRIRHVRRLMHAMLR